MDIIIQPLSTMEEAEGVVEVQRQAWNMDDIGIVPTFETKAVSDAGFVFIAKQNDLIVGFIYGYHHFPDIHYSHMMAVLPEYQGQNIGYKLKQYHRQNALQSQHYVRAVQWTVDPLLPNNAYLNFAKLGGYCDIYKEDYYGDPSSDGVEIYAGVPTDRFKLTWPIHSDRVTKRMHDYKSDRVTEEELQERSPGINHIENNKPIIEDELPQTSFTYEVPANYQYIRRNHISVARNWRMKFRKICQSALALDFVVYDYHSFEIDGERKNYYEFIPRDNVKENLS